MRVKVEIRVDYDGWEKQLPDYEDICKKACEETLNNVISNQDNIEDIEISILLSDNNQVQELNSKFRNKDKPTNVLSFPSEDLHHNELKGSVLLGDIALAFQTVEREASEQGKSFKDHFIHLVVHSMLHLLGYDHEEDDQAEKMEKQEILILEQLSVANPY